MGTGIAWAFTRSAFILAVSALDIDEMSGGRFRLGLGAGVKRLNETWHDVDYGKPAPHLRETIEATRLIMEKAPDRRADPLRGRLQGHRHQGLDPAPQAGPRAGADLRRRDAGGDVPDGRRRRRRADRPSDVPAALARRGGDPELRGGAPALRPAALRPRLHPHRHLRDRRRRGPRARRRAPHDRLLLDGPHLQAALGDARLRRRGGRRGRRVPQGRPGGGARSRSPTRWSRPTPPRARSTRSASGSPRRPSAATASSSPRPPTSSRPSRSASTSSKIVEAFGADHLVVRERLRRTSTNFCACRAAAARGRSRTSFGLERRQLPGRAAVLAPGRVSGRASARAGPGIPVVMVHVGEHVAEDQHPVGLAPEGDVSGRVPGTSITLKPPTSCPSLSAGRPCGRAREDARRRTARHGWSGWRSPISSGSSAAGTSSSGTRNGIPSCSQTSWLAPWWSGCAWVSAWVFTSCPSSCFRIRAGRLPRSRRRSGRRRPGRR